MTGFVELFHKLSFRLRHQALGSRLRVMCNRALGMHVGEGTCISAGFNVSWPQCITIGRKCFFEPNVTFKVDAPWSLEKRVVIGDEVFIGAGVELNIARHISIGNRALIASGCRFIDHNHGFEKSGPIRPQYGDVGAIEIGDDVWLGVNVVVLTGVNIGEGAVVGAGAVVTKNIPSNEVWAGIPARKINNRPSS